MVRKACGQSGPRGGVQRSSPQRDERAAGDGALLLAALQRLRGHADVEAELEDMRAEAQAERAEGRLSVLNLCTFRPLRWQLVSIVVLMAGQQLSGINAVRRTWLGGGGREGEAD